MKQNLSRAAILLLICLAISYYPISLQIKSYAQTHINDEAKREYECKLQHKDSIFHTIGKPRGQFYCALYHNMPARFESICNLDILKNESMTFGGYKDTYLKYLETHGVKIGNYTFFCNPHFDSVGIDFRTPQPTSAKVVRATNEAAAKLKYEHPDRFRFCAALPLPDVDAAIEEARYALDVLSADGIKLATNVGGQYLGAPELDNLFSFLNERKAVVILHPHRPDPVNKQVMQQTPLAMQEYLSETTRAVSNMILTNWRFSLQRKD